MTVPLYIRAALGTPVQQARHAVVLCSLVGVGGVFHSHGGGAFFNVQKEPESCIPVQIISMKAFTPQET